MSRKCLGSVSPRVGSRRRVHSEDVGVSRKCLGSVSEVSRLESAHGAASTRTLGGGEARAGGLGGRSPQISVLLALRVVVRFRSAVPLDLRQCDESHPPRELSCAVLCCNVLYNTTPAS